jgi:hypothetical protein
VRHGATPQLNHASFGARPSLACLPGAPSLSGVPVSLHKSDTIREPKVDILKELTFIREKFFLGRARLGTKKLRKPNRSVFSTSALFGAMRRNSQFLKGYNFSPRVEKFGCADKLVSGQITSFCTLPSCNSLTEFDGATVANLSCT